jgi:NADH dehydrogenase
MGVEVMTSLFVKSYDRDTVLLSNGESIKSRQVIWTAGVTGNLISGLREESQVKGGRFRVNRYNQVDGYDDIFAAGDIACMETPLYPQGHPQVANVAINQAKNLARNLKAMLTGKALHKYEYTNLGSMATVGRNKAVVDLPFVSFKGKLAWFTWMFLHLMLILSVRNKLIIFINWAWNYLTGDTSLRLILKDRD